MTTTYEYLYDMGYNETCEQDSSLESSVFVVLPVFYYLLFCLGLLGMFKKMLKGKKKT